MTVQGCDVAIEIGGLPIRVQARDRRVRELVERRYSGFLCAPTGAEPSLEVRLRECGFEAEDGGFDPEAELSVTCGDGRWRMQRGDFSAEWDARAARGAVIQPPTPYALDSTLRILHSLLLSDGRGFLAHAAGVIRKGKAFLFAGKSGAGKTTLSRLAPPDARLLSDEISYVRREAAGFRAYGTPFSGELGRSGENVSAPIAAWFTLVKADEDRLLPLRGAAAVRALMANVLFFAAESEPVSRVFESACDFAASVPGHEMHFRPEAAAWEMIA